MNLTISENTKAILLLTAPLLAAKTTPSNDLLTPGEYRSWPVIFASGSVNHLTCWLRTAAALFESVGQLLTKDAWSGCSAGASC